MQVRGEKEKHDPAAKPQNLAARQEKTNFLGGVLPYKSDRGKKKCTRILFYGRVPNSLPPLIATNSTTTTYATGTAKLIVIKITFEHFLLKDFLKVLSYIFILISHFRF